jgi:hypothetical protein
MVKAYKLIKEYPGFGGEIGIEANIKNKEFRTYYIGNDIGIPFHESYFKDFPEYWQPIEDKIEQMETKKNIVNIPVDIPEGYELDGNLKLVENFEPTYWRGANASIYRPCLYVPLKKKEVKDFNLYIEEYFKAFRHIHISEIIIPDLKGLFKENKYLYIPFEIKIGLLKFICDDLGHGKVQFVYVLDCINKKEVGFKLLEICPKEFLYSIFNEKDSIFKDKK